MFAFYLFLNNTPKILSGRASPSSVSTTDIALPSVSLPEEAVHHHVISPLHE
jgi:hypothetical protein